MALVSFLMSGPLVHRVHHAPKGKTDDGQCYLQGYSFFKNLFESEQEREREGETLICCSTYLCIHCFLNGIEPETLVCQDNALTN